MAVIKKHWFAVTFNTALIVVAVAWVILAYALPRVVQGQSAIATPVEALSVYDYQHVQALRRDLTMSNADLGAMGLTQVQAEQMIGTIRDWYLANKAAADQYDRNIQTAKRNLRQTMQKIHVGPRNETVLRQMPGLQKQLADAATAKKAMLDNLASQLVVRLETAQQSRWQKRRDNAGLPEPYRGTTLNQAQLQQLTRAARRPEAAGSIENNILNFSQKQQIQEARQIAASHMSGVIKADETMLPLPEELKPEAVEPVIIEVSEMP
ncbi:hypothetical protein HED60_04385 [Planctomycetales bacterium ZRK34]|nr:hypothetical protein HED60_04385 [Planctomycetales bacterium ZRK34]